MERPTEHHPNELN